MRLLDDVDTCVPMIRALFRAEVLRADSMTEGNTAVAAFVSGRVCRRLLVASTKVSCLDKKGSRYGPHALEQAMALLCASSSTDYVANLEAANTPDDTTAHFRNSCIGFCRTIADAPLESCPGVLRAVCCYVREQLTARGATSKVQRSTLSAIFSLCYVCPALRDPAAFGISGFPQPFSASGRALMVLVAAGLEREMGFGDKRSSKRQLSADVWQVLTEMRELIGEFCFSVLGEVRELGAPGSGASGTSMQPMSGHSFMSGGSLEEAVMSPEVFKDLERVASFASSKLEVLKDILEVSGHQAVALAFEEELNRKELALRAEEIASLEQASKEKYAMKPGRVCTLPGLARIKGGKGRLFGLKYRELRSDEEGSDETSDEDVQMQSRFPSLVLHRVAVADTAGREPGKEDDDSSTGVGLQFEHDTQGYLRVLKIAAGGPAERCGMIDVGDVLVDISGQNIYVHDDPLKALRGMILGKVGTVIEFGLQKPGSGQAKQIKLRRAERYSSDAKNDADIGLAPILQSSTRDASQQQVRPRVRVRTTFTKGQSEHSRPRGELALGAHARPHGYASAPGGPRWEGDAITSTASVGSEKFELSGTGVTIKIGDDCMFYVHDILAGGPAERNGCLSHGDRVIAINDVSLEGRRLEECARLLNGSMGTVANLDLISLGDFGSSEPQVKRVTLRRTWVPDMVWNAAGDEVAPRQEETVDNGSDQSAKQAFVPHGVGITFTKTQNDSTFSVKRVTEGGPADMAGTIQSGDIIKTVDGVSVERKSYRQFARMILGPLGSIVQLGIERGVDREQHLVQLERGPAASTVVSEASSDSMLSGDGDVEPPSRTSSVPQTNVSYASRTLQDVAPEQMVGVGLKCDRLDDGKFIVAGVQPIGPSARSGRICVGDRVLAVGGVDLTGRSKTDLRTMIMGVAGSIVYLQIVHANGSQEEVNLTRETTGTPGKTSVPEWMSSGGNIANNSGLGDLGLQTERIEGGLLRVSQMVEGGGAFQSQNVRVGDIISEIDGVRVVHLDDQTVSGLLCGVPGTHVNLALRSHDGSDQSVAVLRTPCRVFGIDGGRPLGEEKSFDVGSEYGDDDSERGSRSRKTGLGMSFKNNHTGMIIVRRVKEGGPAERLGIREGDTIVALDGFQLQNMYSDKKELSRLMLGYSGSQVTVTLQRKGHTKIEEALLTRGHKRDEAMASITPQESWKSDQSSGSVSKAGLGLTFVKPDGQPGVVVKRVKGGGAAAATGNLSPGDRVLQIDGAQLLQVTSKILTNLVMGPEGSIANLEVRRRDGSIDHVSIMRGDPTMDSHGPPQYLELRSEPSIDFFVSGESRRERCGLGITFRQPDGMPGMVVNRIKDNGPAVGTGIERGDRLLSVDGVYLESSPSSELSKILLGLEGTQARLEMSKADGRTVFVLVTRGEGSFGLHSESSRESVTSSVDSEAASDVSTDQDSLAGIGLTFHRPDGQGGVLVKRVKEGSVALANSRIAPGDRLLAIDGNALGTNISHVDLTQMVLGKSGSSICLHMQYSSGDSEEVVLQRGATVSQGSGASDMQNPSTQSLCGLGVTFFPPTDGDGHVVIKRVKPGGAAQVSRLVEAGDRLTEIDGKQVHLLSGSELKSLLMGFPGSVCTVRVQHQNGMSEDVNLVRAAKDEPLKPAGPLYGITTEMSLDEVAFAAAASKGERKRKVGLGMVLNEDDGGEGLAIRKVKQGSASALSAKVRAGDRLLSIDGTSLGGLGRQEIEKLVMRPVDSTSVCVLRRKDGSLDHVMLQRVELPEQVEEDLTAVDEDDTEQLQEPHKSVGLGMVFLRPDGKGGRVIKRLKEESAADAHKDVLPGDRCLTINDKAIEKMTDRELSDVNKGPLGSTAAVVLRSKSGIAKHCVLKRRTPVFDSIVEVCGSELSYDSSIASGLTASDTAGRTGLGLTFHEWNSGSGGLRVKRVKIGGAADNCRKIHPGDIVQSIDGFSLEKIEHHALLKLLMGPEGSIAVLKLSNSKDIACAKDIAWQVILTRVPRGGLVSCGAPSSPSPSTQDERSAAKRGGPPSSALGAYSSEQAVSPVSLMSATAGTSPRVLPVKMVSPPQALAQLRSSPPPPSQMPKVIMPVASVSYTEKKTPPLPPPAKKLQVQQASVEAKEAPTVEASDFKPLLMGMGAAFAQESLPDNGDDDDDTSFGEPSSDHLRDDLSEISMDDSVLGDGDEEDDVRRQCGLGVTFKKSDGQGGVVVKRVKPGGGAELGGDLKPGDRVLRLDGMPLDHLSQAELASMTIGDEDSESLLEVIKTSTGQEMMITITRLRSTRGLSFADKEVREYSLVSGQLSHESSREDFNDEDDLEYKDGRKVPRIARTGLGLTFKPLDGKGGVVVKRVKEDGPALGIVKDGDRIISIDDWSINEISNTQLTRLTLGIPGTEVVLKIIRPGVGEIPDVTICRPQAPGDALPSAPAVIPHPAPAPSLVSEGSSDSIGSQVSASSSVAREVAGHPATANAGHRATAKLSTAKLSGIGLTFRPKSDGAGVTVKRVKEDGPAALEGSISAGDVVVSIDGVAIGGLDQITQGKLMMGKEASVATLVILKKGTGQQKKVMLERRRPGDAATTCENSSDSIGSISSEVSTSSSIFSPDPPSTNSAKLVGIGLTFSMLDNESGGLPVKRVKEDGAAAGSSIKSGDIVLSIDGVELGALDKTRLAKVMMGEIGSVAHLEILKKDGQRERVRLNRSAAPSSMSETSTDSVGSLSSEASIASISSSRSPTMHIDGVKLVGIGLTFLELDKESGGLPVKRIKDDGAAVNSTICPGDIVVSIDGVGPVGTLDTKALTKAMMGPPGSTAKVEVLKKKSGQKDIVLLTRGAPFLRQGSNESIGSSVQSHTPYHCSTPSCPFSCLSCMCFFLARVFDRHECWW